MAILDAAAIEKPRRLWVAYRRAFGSEWNRVTPP
jgi:hypothetical protein